MTDTLSPDQRHRCMQNVKSKNTAPEIAVRKALHRMGFRFRLHAKGMPGKPDIVLPKHRIAIFVHGCFWHSHEGCARSARPSTNVDFWSRKLSNNVIRDARIKTELQNLGWDSIIIWQCQARDPERISRLLRDIRS